MHNRKIVTNITDSAHLWTEVGKVLADLRVRGGWETPHALYKSNTSSPHYQILQGHEQGDVKSLASLEAYLFPRRRKARTEASRRSGIKNMLARYCQEADIPYGRMRGGLTFHWATRRTGATRMLTRKVDPGTVQKVGRWKNPDIVLGIYHELIDEKAIAAVESVGPRAEK